MDVLRFDPNVLGILTVLTVHFFNPALISGVTSYFTMCKYTLYRNPLDLCSVLHVKCMIPPFTLQRLISIATYSTEVLGLIKLAQPKTHVK